MAGRRHALIVATGAYDDPDLLRLRSPVQDASALAAVLTDPRIGDFDVVAVRDEPHHLVSEKMDDFFADRRADDLLVVHLSCHGVKDDDGRLFFAATNTKRRRLDSTAISADYLNRLMTRCRAGTIVLLLDCCYSGAFAKGTKSDRGVHLKEKFEGRGRAVLTASNAIEYAWEGDRLSGNAKSSLFTTAIVRGLSTGEADRDRDGLVSINDLYEYVYDRVTAQRHDQTPLLWLYGTRGALQFAKSPRPPVIKGPTRRAPLPPANRQRPRQRRRRNRIVDAAMSAAVLSLAFLTIGVIRYNAREKPPRDLISVVEATSGADGLIPALLDESAWSTADLIGQGELVAVRTEGHEGTRRQTDRAIAVLREHLEGKEDTNGFAPAMDYLDLVSDHRLAIDSDPSPHLIANLEDAWENLDWYRQPIDQLFRATSEGRSERVDDPETREAIDQVDTITRQVDLLLRIEYEVLSSQLLSPTAALNTADAISSLSGKQSTFKSNANTMGVAPEPFRSMVDEYIDPDAISRVNELIDSALRQGEVDVQEWLDAVRGAQASYLNYLAVVQERLERAIANVESNYSLQMLRLNLATGAIALAALLWTARWLAILLGMQTQSGRPGRWEIGAAQTGRGTTSSARAPTSIHPPQPGQHQLSPEDRP